METLTWLHLSDWHQGNKGKMDRNVVRDALIEDIEKRATNCHPKLAKLDFIVFSGDLAFRGAEDEFNNAATAFLDPVLKAADVPPERLFMVPGNHDVDRSRLAVLPNLLEKFDERAKVSETFEDPEMRQHLLFPIKAYSKFVGKYLECQHLKEPEYGFVSPIRPANASTRSVAIMGLNSAWMCGQFKDQYRNGEVNDYGRLILGEHQFRRCLSEIEGQKPELIIGIMHHPFSWFSETEDRFQLEDALLKKCHFVLRGHEHRPAVTVPYGTVGECAVISAGSAYDRRQYPNGYNYVIVDFESGQGIVHLREYDDRAGKFMKDHVLTSETSAGFVTFPLPKELGRNAAPNRNFVMGDPWGGQSPATMRAIAEVYEKQHQPSKFIQVSGELIVEANSLSLDPEPDLVIIRMRFKAGLEPIYCHRVTLMQAEGSGLQGDLKFSVKDSDGKDVDIISLPMVNPPSDPSRYPTKELILFFTPILQPDGREYTLEIKERVKDSLRPLLKRGKDDLFIMPRRSSAPIGQLTIILLTPPNFGEIAMHKGERDTTGVNGIAMTPEQIDLELRKTGDFPRRTGFRAYGWRASDTPNGERFAVDLVASQPMVSSYGNLER